MVMIQNDNEYAAINSRIGELLKVVNDDTPLLNPNNLELVDLSYRIAAYDTLHCNLDKPKYADLVCVEMVNQGLSPLEASRKLGIPYSRFLYILVYHSPSKEEAIKIEGLLKVCYRQ